MKFGSFVSSAVIVASMLASTAAYAQTTSSNVVLMRRSLDPKTRTYAWVPGEWSQCSNSCGAGQQTRSVQCMMNGKHGSPEVNCGPGKPAEVQACYDVQACSYTWQPTEWTDVQGCGQVVETRELSCLRSDGQTVSNDQCPRPAPDTAREVRDLRTCSYSWKSEDWSAWSDYCKTGAERGRDVYCLRSNGERAEDSFCGKEGPKPAVRETGDRYEQCGYSWKEKPWGDWSSTCQTAAVRKRDVVCLRSNGDEVPDAMCGGAGAKPALTETADRYEGCSYSWRSGDWGAVTPACGSSSKSRTVECLRSNGDVVADASCDPSKRPATAEAVTDYQTCTYDWKPDSWSAPSSSCGSATATRSVACVSSDGRTVDEAFCKTAKPEESRTTYETSGCSYSWQTGAFGAPTAACGSSTQYRSVWCLRSDGQTVADGSCPAGSRPADSQGATDYSTCTYSWNPGAWSAPSTTCGQASYTRPITCLSSDGRTVADSFCSGARPEATKSDYVTSGCSYSWSAGAFGSPVPACGATVQNRPVTCLRSDGQTVADASCNAGTRPATQQAATDYSTCTYGWTATAWGAWSSACGNATQIRNVTCQSSDGRTVADSFCNAGSKPAASQDSYQTSGCGYSWQAGTFGTPAAACGASTQTRSVTCLRSDGQTVSDAFCPAGSRPGSTQGATDYSTCSYSWSAAGWSAPSTMCGSATQTRSVVCVRSDGTTVADAACSAGSKPATSQGSYQTASCSYARVSPSAWSGWDNACSGSANRTRTYQCQRSDGAIVDGGECTARGISLTETETGANYTNACPGYFTTGAWSDYGSHCSASATRTRTVTCYRSGDNVFAGDQYCTDRGLAVPARSETTGVYDGCGYSWKIDPWSAPAPACGASTQTRNIYCMRSDGTWVPEASCSGLQRPATSQSATDYSACSYGWAASGWSAWSTGCGQATQTRSVWCQRSDGTTVGDASCGGAKPTASQSAYQTYACGYTWQAGGWGAPTAACGASTQYRAVWCQRSDGATVDGSLCGGGQPASSQGASDYSACSYSWAYNGWSTTSQTCGNITQARSVWCQRSDGTTVAEGYCGGGKPATSQSWADYSACGYTWQASGYSVPSGCGPVTATQDVWCQRSDGTRVAESSCGGGRPSNTASTTNYSACSYSWQTGAWSAQQSVCGSATQTREVWCQRTDGARVEGSFCGGGQPASSTTYTNYNACSYTTNYGPWSACPTGANATQTRTNTCTRVQTNESVDPQTYCGVPSQQSQTCFYNPGGSTAGTVLGTYAFATCSQQYDYGTMGTMPGINPGQCRTAVATYARKCSNGGNLSNNANCDMMAWVNNPRGPTGYPCDIICR